MCRASIAAKPWALSNCSWLAAVVVAGSAPGAAHPVRARARAAVAIAARVTSISLGRDQTGVRTPAGDVISPSFSLARPHRVREIKTPAHDPHRDEQDTKTVGQVTPTAGPARVRRRPTCRPETAGPGHNTPAQTALSAPQEGAHGSLGGGRRAQVGRMVFKDSTKMSSPTPV